jgi:hypothetical protein
MSVSRKDGENFSVAEGKRGQIHNGKIFKV